MDQVVDVKKRLEYFLDDKDAVAPIGFIWLRIEITGISL
jgi:hypothetical protein